MNTLPRSFYRRDTVEVARDLLGKILISASGPGVTSGIITETEAYRSDDDPASHAFNGMTGRNRAMFGEVGRAYVYFTYGMHYCMNAVARDGSRPAGAVLIRAIAPASGLEIMVERRGARPGTDLAGGPAKLAQALGITGEQYGDDLTLPGGLSICGGADPGNILAGPRVGIRCGTDLKWNFKMPSRRI